MVSYKFVIAVLALHLGLVVAQSVLVELNEKIDSSIRELDGQFATVSNDFFWNRRNLAQQLATSNEQLSKELLNMAQVATMIESVKYAIRRKSLLVARELVGQRFVESGDGILDTHGGVVMFPQLMKALVSRAILRGYADSARFTEYTWNWLHKLIEFNVNRPNAEPHLRSVAIDAYKSLAQFQVESLRANVEYKATLDWALAEIGITPAQASFIVTVLDQIINAAVGCQACSRHRPGLDYFGTNSMFDNDQAVELAIKENVDPKLEQAFADYEGVHFVSPEEQASVTKAQVESLMKKFLS